MFKKAETLGPLVDAVYRDDKQMPVYDGGELQACGTCKIRLVTGLPELGTIKADALRLRGGRHKMMFIRCPCGEANCRERYMAQGWRRVVHLHQCQRVDMTGFREGHDDYPKVF